MPCYDVNMRGDHFWRLEHCSNDELLCQLESIMSHGRRLTAELVAHLGEVEERRLHLEAAYSSMFDYCVRRLGLSEDEAYRRIEVARLARRFPALFPLLAAGELSLTVAALLKPHLSPDNETRLIAAVRGKTAVQAREVLAGLFPRPDAPELVRKLPAPRTPALATPPDALAIATTQPVPAPRVAPPTPLHRIEPLSEERYRVQLTVGTALKGKLDQARDLMRHRNPSGDVAPIIERALDLLLEQLMKERFGVTDKPRQRESSPERVSNAARRSVLTRDGLQCSWVDNHGRRCPSRAWLEHDHRTPRGKGGDSEAENIRTLCRAHNRLAAEREYGRPKIDAAIRRRQTSQVSGPEHVDSP